MIISTNNARFSYADHLIFDNVNIEINEGERVGLVSGNGTGKTTLIRCLVKELSLDSGSITYASNLSIGYLCQHSDYTSNLTVYQQLDNVFSYEHSLIAQLAEVSSKMTDSSGAEYDKLTNRYNNIMSEIDRLDAYNTDVKLNTVLNGMALSKHRDSVISTLSGGERSKVELCKLLLSKPQLLVLDEPTNHLDLVTMHWLQEYLLGVNTTMLIVSHDRWFLDNVATNIIELYNGTAYSYKGNYTKYITLRTARLDNESKQYAKQQLTIDKLTDYVARNKARASTANMAKSRQKTLDKMQVMDNPIVNTLPPTFKFSCSDQPSEKAITVKNLSVSFGEKHILNDVSMIVERGSKVALVGANGCGKTTLLKHIVGLGLDKAGTVIMGKNVRLGYYDQNVAQFDSSLSVMDQLWYDNTLMSQTDIRSILALVGFRGDSVFKSTTALSGGEKARLLIAMLMVKDNNVLLLDEPTNHLDLLAREQLEKAIVEYNGTVLFVSHDRYFIDKIATHVVAIDKGEATSYAGNYSQYYSLMQSKPSTANTAKVVSVAKSNNSGYRSSQERKNQTNAKIAISRLERRLEAIYTEQTELNERMLEPSVASDYVAINDICKQIHMLEEEAEGIFVQLEELGV